MFLFLKPNDHATLFRVKGITFPQTNCDTVFLFITLQLQELTRMWPSRPPWSEWTQTSNVDVTVSYAFPVDIHDRIPVDLSCNPLSPHPTSSQYLQHQCPKVCVTCAVRWYSFSNASATRLKRTKTRAF